jgi:hypothetical protein
MHKGLTKHFNKPIEVLFRLTEKGSKSSAKPELLQKPNEI